MERGIACATKKPPSTSKKACSSHEPSATPPLTARSTVPGGPPPCVRLAQSAAMALCSRVSRVIRLCPGILAALIVPGGDLLSQGLSFSFFRTRRHIDNRHQTGVSHHTKRSPERAPSTTTSEPRGSFFLPSRASLLRWPLPRLIYTTLLVVPRASTRYSGPPPEGSGRVSSIPRQLCM